MQNNKLPTTSDKAVPSRKQLYNNGRGKKGHSKISAILFISAIVLASALTVLLVQNTAS